MERTSIDYEQLTISILNVNGFLIVNKQAIKAFGITGAVLLSNYIEKYLYYKEHYNDKYNGWFYLTYSRIKEELNLSDDLIRKYKDQFIAEGIMESARHTSMEWVKVNFKVLYRRLNFQRLETPGGSAGKIQALNNKTKRNKKLKIKKVKSDFDSRVAEFKENVFLFKSRHDDELLQSFFEYWSAPADTNPELMTCELIKPFYIGRRLGTFKRNKNKFKKERVNVDTKTNSPNKIIVDGLKKESSTVKSWMRENYDDAVELVPASDKLPLAARMVELYYQIKNKRPDDAMTAMDESYQIGTEQELIQEYIYWLGHQDWITEITIKLFSFDSTLFQKFLRYRSNQLGLNVMTGRYE